VPSAHDRNQRGFQEFRPPTGPFKKSGSVHRGWLLKRLAGEHITLVRAAAYIEDQIQVLGSRFAISSRRLGAALGMSQSTGSRCLRKLRDLGLLALWRAHTVRKRFGRWTGAPAVHEVAMTHPYGDDRLRPPRGVSHVPWSADICSVLDAVPPERSEGTGG
jgi:hypothetical protein